MIQIRLNLTNQFLELLKDSVNIFFKRSSFKSYNNSFSAIMEGVQKYLKMRDRKLTDFYLGLAVEDHFNPVYNDHFIQVQIIFIH